MQGFFRNVRLSDCFTLEKVASMLMPEIFSAKNFLRGCRVGGDSKYEKNFSRFQGA